MSYAFLQATVLDDGGAVCEGRFGWGYSLVAGAIFAPTYTWWQRSISPYDQFPFWNYPPLYAHGSGLVTDDQFTALELYFQTGIPIYYQAQLRQIAVPGTVVTGAIVTFTIPIGGSGGGGYGASPYALPAWAHAGPLEPSVSIQAATLITSNRATLNGIVSSQGDLAGNVRFHWGTSTNYGMTTPWRGGIGTGTSFTAEITGLSQGSAYHAKAEFKNSHSPAVFSGDLTFSTLSETGGMVLGGGDILTLLGG
jgi:hypothetical protein